MRRLKKNQAQNCTACKSEGIKRPAMWREDGWTGTGAYCDEHKHLIPEHEDNGYMTEADYQIERRWGI